MFWDWHQLWEVISTPDNIPIVALLFFVPFYTWYAFRQAKETDDLIGSLKPIQQRPRPRIARPIHLKGLGSGSAYLAIPAARGVGGRDNCYRTADGVVALAERAVGRTFESQRDDESGEGAVVFPGIAGNAGVFRSMDRGRDYAHVDHRRADGGAVY